MFVCGCVCFACVHNFITNFGCGDVRKTRYTAVSKRVFNLVTRDRDTYYQLPTIGRELGRVVLVRVLLAIPLVYVWCAILHQ